MKKIFLLSALAVAFVAAPACRGPNSYQVTGPVVALNADTITVKKGTENWEIARGSTNVPSTVKVGSKVTVQYTMTATTVTDKSAATPAKGKGAANQSAPTAMTPAAAAH